MEDPVLPADSEASNPLALLLVLGSAELVRLGEREELAVPALPEKDTESWMREGNGEKEALAEGEAELGRVRDPAEVVEGMGSVGVGVEPALKVPPLLLLPLALDDRSPDSVG